MASVLSDAAHGPLGQPLPVFDATPIIPKDVVSQFAYTWAAKNLDPAILNHSLRVYLYLKHIIALPLPYELSISPRWKHDGYGKYSTRTEEHKQTLMFIAALYHAVAVVDQGDRHQERFGQRFEVCGADGAEELLELHQVEGSEEVWMAIACHTSPGIGEVMGPLTRALRLAVLTDFNSPGVREEMGLLTTCEEMESKLHRLNIEKVLGDAVVRQVKETREGKERKRKAPDHSWPGDLWKGYLEMVAKHVDEVNPYF